MEKKLTFQKFTEIASYEVYKALGKQYDVRNAVLKEIMPQCSAEIAVILVTKVLVFLCRNHASKSCLLLITNTVLFITGTYKNLP